ncbi:MAG TPA: hypothetical protein VF306_13075 [Pirellulales bacterium]
MKARFLTALLASALLLAASNSAQAYRRGYGRGGGYGGYGAGSTVAGSFLAGSAMLTRSAGQFTLNASQASKNYQDAYQHWLQNQKLRVSTYFDIRRMYASYRAEKNMQHPPPTEEQVAGFNKMRLPQPLSANDFDPAHGVLKWPSVLRNKQFDDQRHQLEGLFTQASEDPQSAGLGTDNYRQIRRAIGNLHDKLHSHIDDYTPAEYIAATKFLKSLDYQARLPATSVASK